MEHAEGACSVVRHRNAWFVFYDAYRPDSLPWLAKAIADHDPAKGPLLFVVHPPVVPYTGRLWHVFEKGKESAERRAQLLQLLAAHRAVVLNGHLHRYGLLRRAVGDAGWFDQLSVISVIPEPDVKPREELAGPDAYGPSLTDLEPQFSPATLEQRQAVLAAERPSVSRFEHANLPGYAVLHFRGDGGITADLYRGVGQGVWRTRMLNPTAS
jgi:hypothetical protein